MVVIVDESDDFDPRDMDPIAPGLIKEINDRLEEHEKLCKARIEGLEKEAAYWNNELKVIAAWRNPMAFTVGPDSMATPEPDTLTSDEYKRAYKSQRYPGRSAG